MSPPDDNLDIEVIDLASKIDTATRRTALVAPAETSRRPRRRGPQGRWRWVAVGLVAGVVWLAVSVAAVLGMRADVMDARATLLGGRDLLASGEVDAAANRFDDAAERLGTLPTRARGVAVWPARLLPGVRRSLDAVGALGQAGAVAAGAAGDVAAQLAAGEGGLGALTPRDGRIPLEAIANLSPVLLGAAADMERALELARSAPATGVDDAVADGRQEFLRLLEPTVADLRLVGETAEILPPLFGAEGPRRYLVVASNPSESRGTGGFLGAYTLVEVEDGRMSFGEAAETQDLPFPDPDNPVEYPDESLERRWGPYGMGTRIRSMNMTPDFPAAAEMIERYWRAVVDQPIDGVIAVDPFAFESLLRISGPVDLADFGEVTADEIVEFVSYDAYALEERPAVRKRLLGNVAASALQGFLRGPGDVTPEDVLRALGQMARRDSLLIHSVRPEEQALLEEAGLAGVFSNDGADMLAVINNSGSGSKIDYFLDRSVRYDVRLRDDGGADAVVSAGFVNTAPTTGELTYMIGPPDDQVPFGAGDNVLYTSVYCAPGCEFSEVPDAGYQDIPTDVTSELGYPVASTWSLIPSMRALELIYSYEVPGVWSREDGEIVYRLTYVHQTSIRPIEVDVRVAVPEGHEVVDRPEDAAEASGEARIQFTATADRDIVLRFAPS